MHNDKILNQILTRARAASAKGVKSLAVFDLDSTLFDVSPRLKRILVDISASGDFRTRFNPQLSHFGGIEIQQRDWGLADALSRRPFPEPPPAEFFEEVRKYWRRHFFSNEYLEFDIPYPGSIDYVRELHEAGTDIAYLTGRDVERMGVGTLHVLKKWNFPVDERAQLVLKPHRSMDDGVFKSDWFAQLPDGEYGPVWFFENEPVNVNALRKAVPAIEIVFFDSTHSRQEEAPRDIQWVQHFLFDREVP